VTAERLSITVSERCAQTIRDLAERNNSTMSAQIRAAVKAYIGESTLGKDSVIAAYEERIKALEQRLKDKDEMIKSKDEIIKSKDEIIAFLKMRPEKVVFSDDLPEGE
jgi:hypothetical protein